MTPRKAPMVVATVAALMSFTATASATVLVSQGAVVSAGTAIKAGLKEGPAKLTTSVGTIECKSSTVEGKVENAGGAESTVSGSISSLTFAECNCEVKTLKNGSLEIHTEVAEANGNGTLTGSGTEVTTSCSTIFGTVHCIYVTENTDLGTLVAGNPAKLEVKEASIPRLTTNSLCSEEALWTASYEVTSPKPLGVDISQEATASSEAEGGGKGPLTYTVNKKAKIYWTNLTDNELITNGDGVHNALVLKTVGGLCSKIKSTATCENIEIECLQKGMTKVTLGNPPVGVAEIKCD